MSELVVCGDKRAYGGGGSNARLWAGKDDDMKWLFGVSPWRDDQDDHKSSVAVVVVESE